jgi:hypothetical protein
MKAKCKIKIKSILTIIPIVITVGGLIIAINQLNENKKIAKANFAREFKNDFFTPQARELIMLFEYDLLKFEVLKNIKRPKHDIGYFIIDSVKLKGYNKDTISRFFSSSKKFSEFEIVDNLLLHLDDLGYYLRKNLIDIDYIFNCFDYDITLVWENRELQKYLTWIDSDNETKDSYLEMKILYEKLKKYKKQKHLE